MKIWMLAAKNQQARCNLKMYLFHFLFLFKTTKNKSSYKRTWEMLCMGNEKGNRK